MEKYYNKTDGHTYYYKEGILYGAPTFNTGIVDIDNEMPVSEFHIALEKEELVKIENALKKGVWELKYHAGGQIADTGDCDDGLYELTNGRISLFTSNEIDETSHDVGIMLFELSQCKWWVDDSAIAVSEYEINRLREEVQKWKDVSKVLYDAIQSADVVNNMGGQKQKMKVAMQYYKELVKQSEK